MSTPCGWEIPDPLCCPSWAETNPLIQAAALEYAAFIMWSSTGRVFGLCEQVVRPCGMKRCNDGMAEFYGYDWVGGTWIPYIWNGTWFNCSCAGMCCCDPRCQVRLMGPVASILDVTIGGVSVDPATYRVDNEHWLVRTGGECWPQCAEMNDDTGDNVFEVTYERGQPIPAVVLTAASTLACEWAKACVNDGTCRLSNRVTDLARNGISIDMMSPGDLLENGMTGLWEVDAIIRAINPTNLDRRLRIWAPELKVPRTVTSP